MNLTVNQHLAARLIANSFTPGDSFLRQYGQNLNTKHNLEYDFGYPERRNPIPFIEAYYMWRRNGIARALVEKTGGKTWQELPCLKETEEDQEETGLEAEIRQHFSDIRLWQVLHQADMRSMVGKYGGVVFRFADGKRFSEPVDTVPGGVEGLAGILPAWEGQLEPSEWDTNPMSPGYGTPTMFHFNESNVDPEDGKVRSFQVHPDRCYIWSTDRTTWGESKFEPCWNALMDLEKIRGAGGEGFWKNAKAQPVLQAQTGDNAPDFNQLAAMLGTTVDGLPDALDEVVAKWSKGFDVSLMLQGMEAKTLSVSLPSPEHFYNGALQEVSASWPIPQKVLVGMQTGERASTEDQREWAQINMSRRSNMVVPNIMDIIARFERVGVLPERDWRVDWSDLTAPTQTEKMDIVGKMADVNQKMMATGEVVFTDEEMRAIVDYEPLTGDEGFSEIDGGEEDERTTSQAG